MIEGKKFKLLVSLMIKDKYERIDESSSRVLKIIKLFLIRYNKSANLNLPRRPKRPEAIQSQPFPANY